jgi:cytochrome c-type biogenesis protein CcmH/NrfG
MSMTGAVRGAAFAFLLVGAGVGFAAVYPWMHKRAPELAKPLPMLKPRADAANTGAGGASDPVKPPPLNTALLKQLEDKVKSDPKNVGILMELGAMQAEQLNFAEAAKWYKQAVAADGKNVDLRNYLGESLFQANQIDESLAVFRETLALFPSHPEALFDYGYILLQGKNDAKGAIESWEKLVKDNPNFDQIDRVKQLIKAVKERTK